MTIFHSNSFELELVEPGISRKILAHNDNIMAVEVHFSEGAIGVAHSHDAHDQMTYVIAGKFEVTVDGVTKIIEKGDGFLASRHIEHGVKALTEGAVLLDVFNPKRDDFL